MILEWGQFDMRKGIILNQLLKVEEAYAEYEKTGARLDETIKFATLMRCVGGQLKTWLQLQVAETQSYSRLREAIIQYDHAIQRSWDLRLTQEWRQRHSPWRGEMLSCQWKLAGQMRRFMMNP